jgi:hypothetical protein
VNKYNKIINTLPNNPINATNTRPTSHNRNTYDHQCTHTHTQKHTITHAHTLTHTHIHTYTQKETKKRGEMIRMYMWGASGERLKVGIK